MLANRYAKYKKSVTNNKEKFLKYVRKKKGRD